MEVFSLRRLIIIPITHSVKHGYCKVKLWKNTRIEFIKRQNSNQTNRLHRFPRILTQKGNFTSLQQAKI